MERRKANRSSYAKLLSKDPRTVSITSLRRSRSMRASLRILRGKLNQTNLTISPFKFNTHLHKHAFNYEKILSNEEKESENEIKEIKDTPKTNKKLIEQLPSANLTNMQELLSCEDSQQDIEELMSALPMGKVPRKACKLLQIPETYCRKYLKELQHEQKQQQKLHISSCSSSTESVKDTLDDMDNLHEVRSNNRKNLIYEDFSKSVGEGIYGTTRLRTATIRKPMPYLNSNNIIPSSLSPNKSATLRSDRSSYNSKHCKNISNYNNYQYKYNSTSNSNTNNIYNDDNLVILRKPSSSLTNAILSTSSSSAKLSSSTTTTINHLHQINLLQQHNSNNFNSLDSNHYQDHIQQQQHQHQHHQYQPKQFYERENTAFRWSEQLTQNVVSVAKIRSAMSCTAQDIKEMEFLLPQRQHQHQYQYQQRQQLPANNNNLKLPLPPPTNTISASSTLSLSSSSSISSNSSCSTKMLAENIKSASTSATKNNNSLSISRHSNSHKQHHIGGNMDEDGKRNGTGVDENNTENNRNLAIYRQPSNIRTTKGGNTPHRSKMSKKQLKLAQAQLDKLTQCNLHLHGNNKTKMFFYDNKMVKENKTGT